MQVPDLVLDPSLRYWALLPISFVMVLVGLMRSYVAILLRPTAKVANAKKFREQQYLRKGALLKTNVSVLHDANSFNSRRQYLIEAYNSGKFLSEELKVSSEPQMPPAPSTDVLFGMVKGNLANYVPQTVIMWWVNYFFAGFVVLKLPFPLTVKFKTMLQSGIQTSDLDVRYASSVSWYFANLLGLRSIYSLVLSEEQSADAGQVQQQQQPMLVPPVASQMDKAFKAEAENLGICRFESCLDGIEKRVLNKWEN